jgi:hypothetical protein
MAGAAVAEREGVTMGTKYRVDRSMAKLGGHPPCGMNSLLYLGDNEKLALEVFNVSPPGYSPWGSRNASYGITMAVWNGTDFIVKRQKGGI